jgi:hypothetical protein
MMIKRHLAYASAELFSAIFLALSIVYLPFKHLMFRGPDARVEFVAYCFSMAAFALIFPLYSLNDVRTSDWYLDGTKLLKKRKDFLEGITVVDLREVLRFRCRREVPFIGRSWDLRLTMTEVLSEPAVLLAFAGIKITESPGMHRRYHIGFITRHDRNTLLAALAAAKADKA